MSNDHYIHEEESRDWDDLEEAAYEEWCALLKADPAYPLWLESLNHQQDYANEIRR